jgi:nucleoside-diphosphate-sugar epimerase
LLQSIDFFFFFFFFFFFCDVRPSSQLHSDLSKPDTYKHLLPKVTAVVDTTSPDFSTGNPKANHISLLELLKPLSTPGHKKTYIYTGGVLTGGDHKFVKDEAYPDVLPAMQWRADLEADILSYATHLNTIILRPGYVFGGYGGIQNALFSATDKVIIHGRADKVWSWIHVDDLADAYVRAVNRAAYLGPQVFYLGSTGTHTYEQVAKKAAELSGKSPNLPIEVVPAEGWNAITDVDARVSTKKAFELLGWVPKHLDFVEEMDIYYNVYKAYTNL